MQDCHGVSWSGARLLDVGGEWRQLVGEVFPAVRSLEIPGEADRLRQSLTPEIRAALKEYAEEELLTTTFIAVAAR